MDSAELTYTGPLLSPSGRKFPNLEIGSSGPLPANVRRIRVGFGFDVAMKNLSRVAWVTLLERSITTQVTWVRVREVGVRVTGSEVTMYLEVINHQCG